MKRSSLTFGLLGLALLGLAVFGMRYGRPGAEVSTTVPSLAVVNEPTPVASPTRLEPGSRGARVHGSQEAQKSSTHAPLLPSTHALFTQVRSLSPP